MTNLRTPTAVSFRTQVSVTTDARPNGASENSQGRSAAKPLARMTKVICSSNGATLIGRKGRPVGAANERADEDSRGSLRSPLAILGRPVGATKPRGPLLTTL